MDDDINYGDADSYVNDSSIEMAWAAKAAERANIHMNLLMACDPTTLRLNKLQDSIYTAFRKDFPSLDVAKVTHVELKEGGMKEKWRTFCEQFKETVDDFALGSLMRIEACKSYHDENTVIVPKIIYLAIEIARNVEGVNKALKPKFTEDHELKGIQA